MEIDYQRALIADKRLSELVQPQLARIIEQIERGENPFYFELPENYGSDRSPEELASLVARSANAHGRAAHFAGMARAEAKLQRGRFERKYKRSRSGKNEAERNANAMESASAEHIAACAAEAVAELAEAYENSSRVASESIRKIYGSAETQLRAEQREQRGFHRPEEYSPA